MPCEAAGGTGERVVCERGCLGPFPIRGPYPWGPASRMSDANDAIGGRCGEHATQG